MAQTFNTSISFVQSTSRKDRRKGAGSLSVSAVAGGGVGSVADSATQAWVRNNFVDKTTEQEISAPKIFSQGIKIGDIALYKHPDGYVYLDETLVLKGGVVMYGNGSGTEVPSIFESLPIDGRTIKRDGNGALYVDETALSVSGGGGVADSVYWNNVIGKPSWIGSTKPTYKYSEIEEKPDLSVYAKITDIPSLNGYATQTWVDNKGYLLATTASSTYQPKITSSNKLAYSLISGTPDLSVYALKTDIPTKLSQLTDDVVSGNYLSLVGGTIKGSVEIKNPTANTNFDSAIILNNNSYGAGATYAQVRVRGNGSNTRYGYINFNTNTNAYFTGFEVGKVNGDTVTPLMSLDGNGAVSFADSITTRSNVYSWANAKTVGHIIAGHNAGGSAAPIISTALASGGYGKLAQVSDQFGLYAYSASDSTPSIRFALYPEDGAIKIMGNMFPVSTTTYNLGSASAKWSNVYASSFIGSLTGNADSATTIYLGNSNANGAFPVPFVSNATVGNKSLFVSTTNTLIFNPSTGGLSAKNFIGNLTGNADSATKLATARTIWGQSFDGTGDITGDLTIPNNNSIKVKSSGGVVYSVLKMSTANSLSIGQESASNGRTTMIYGNLIRLRCGTGGTDALYVNASGNVTIGASDLAGATNKMYVDGTAKFTGDTTFSSKVVIGTIPVYQSADGTLFVDANVVFRGGVAMFGNTTTTINEE